MGLTNACWSSPFFLFFVDGHFNLISQYSILRSCFKIVYRKFYRRFLRINFLLNMEFANANDR